MFTHNPQVRNTFPREKGRAININNLCKRVFPCFQYPWVPEASSGDLQESPSPWSGGWRMGRSKDPGGSPAGPRPLDQGAPSLVTQSTSWAGKGMLWRAAGKSVEKSLSPPVAQGLSQLWRPSQGQPPQVAAVSVAGKNRQQPPQSAPRQSWDPGAPPGLSSPSLAQCV